MASESTTNSAASQIADTGPHPVTSQAQESDGNILQQISREADFGDLDLDLARVLSKLHCSRLRSGTSPNIDVYLRSFIATTEIQNSFFVYDLGHVQRLYQTWVNAMPRVHPFYAVKCNPDPGLLDTLASIGTGFDAASQAEIDSLIRLGVAPERIIFANPYKLPGDLKYAASVGVHMTTFDSVEELAKIAQLHPKATVVLRIKVDDPNAPLPLDLKFGALPFEYRSLIERTASLGLNLLGVSFHVGCSAKTAEVFYNAIREAKKVFDEAIACGLPPLKLLDIGGGFSYGRELNFQDAAAAVNRALEEFFPVELGVKVIAEPGRFFSEGAATLATFIFGKRSRITEDAQTFDYWISDGLYQSLVCLLYDKYLLNPHTLKPSESATCYQSTIFGPTCDSWDIVMKNVWVPEMNYGDWLIFNNIGAYTVSIGSSFNGFVTSKTPAFYVFSECEGDENKHEGTMIIPNQTILNSLGGRGPKKIEVLRTLGDSGDLF